MHRTLLQERTLFSQQHSSMKEKIFSLKSKNPMEKSLNSQAEQGRIERQVLIF